MSTRDDLLELLAEWRKTCSLAGMAYTDADAAAFVAEAYPFNRLDDLAAAESRVADLDRIVNDYIRIGTVDQCAEWKARALVGDETTPEATP